MHLTIGLAAGLALLSIILGINIGRHRMKTNTYLGDGDHLELFKAQRAHANLTEWAPFALILFAGMEYLGADQLYLLIMADIYLIGRICHAIGLINEGERPHILRAIGSLINLFFIVGASIYVLSQMEWPL